MFETAKFSFGLGSDNHSAVHPKIFEAMAFANHGHAHSYGMDEISELARLEFARVLGRPVEPFYVFNGTAANVVSLRCLLQPFESVICSSQSHLHLDECGAFESAHGAKLWTISSQDGKFLPKDVSDVLSRRGDQHYSQPRAVSLTVPTELGVVYSPQELEEWRRFCDHENLYLHWDGARLANAAVHLGLSLKELIDIGQPDAVSFGGTKNGLLGAECFLFFSEKFASNAKFYRKQSMQLPSKTRYLAAQFYAYLRDDLWQDIAQISVGGAKDLSERLKQFPEIKVIFPVESNALFVQLPESWLKPLREQFFFYIWDRQRRVVRWMISFDWSMEKCEALIKALKELHVGRRGISPE
jgi:threonine aldolase